MEQLQFHSRYTILLLATLLLRGLFRKSKVGKRKLGAVYSSICYTLEIATVSVISFRASLRIPAFQFDSLFLNKRHHLNPVKKTNLTLIFKSPIYFGLKYLLIGLMFFNKKWKSCCLHHLLFWRSSMLHAKNRCKQFPFSMNF